MQFPFRYIQNRLTDVGYLILHVADRLTDVQNLISYMQNPFRDVRFPFGYIRYPLPNIRLGITDVRLRILYAAHDIWYMGNGFLLQAVNTFMNAALLLYFRSVNRL